MSKRCEKCGQYIDVCERYGHRESTMSPTPANPVVEAMAAALHADWEPEAEKCDGRCLNDAELALDALLASPEALRWLGSHVEPEKLGYEQVGQLLGPLDRGVIHPPEVCELVYLAPRRGEEAE